MRPLSEWCLNYNVSTLSLTVSDMSLWLIPLAYIDSTLSLISLTSFVRLEMTLDSKLPSRSRVPLQRFHFRKLKQEKALGWQGRKSVKIENVGCKKIQKERQIMYNEGNKRTQHHMKGGALNEKLTMRKLLIHMKSVYQLPQKIKGLTDRRQKIRSRNTIS